ncbi:hypothetical protein [Spongiimicrobium sp. 3-5]|uniref:hypothetical protein n=1 Tax=Spongiimicrobium sp. 3-5 TaxID=3332596 RepID=UPI00397F59F0
MIKKTIIWVSLGLTLGSYAQEKSSANERPKEIEQLLEAVGGQEAWAEAKGFHMLEIAHFGSLKHPLIREYWVDFEKPRIKESTQGILRRQVQALNVDSGWTDREDQELKTWSTSTVGQWNSFWPGIPTRIFHLIAKKDPGLTYNVYEDRIDFFVEGNFAVWIATDVNGNPLAYGRSKNHLETHFLGEILPYGPVNLWKDASEPGGQWKVVMVDYELLSDMSEVSYDLSPKE